jgi:large subunit ribosomal protein L35
MSKKIKLKTKRGAAKRHILTKKSPKRIRQLRGCVMVHVSDVAAVRRMCPYL